MAKDKKDNTQKQSLKLNPALIHLEKFVGKWKMEMIFPANPSTILNGKTSFKWLEESFMFISMGSESGPSQANWIIGRDDSVDTYTVLYFDARGVSRIYQMSLERDVWKMWRNAPGFSQRFTGIMSKDKNTITAKWEKSIDGMKWEHDFELKYKRIK